MMRCLIVTLCLVVLPLHGLEQEEVAKIENGTKPTQVPEKVDIKPKARDEDIGTRLSNILNATGWFKNPKVVVNEGVVFLSGETNNAEFKNWAGELARKTQDTAAVVNQIVVSPPSIWDFSPVIVGLREQWKSVLASIPLILFGLFVLIIAWLLAQIVTWLVYRYLKRRLTNPLLKDVIGWSISLSIFLLGLYIIFNVMGLTTVALTVLGGTGIIGIILGIAFRDITENLLASIFLSINNPFSNGDLVEIEGVMGYVQKLTHRATVLLTVQGFQVEIPNATVLRGILRNYSVHPQRREDFMVNLSYADSIAQAQELALKVLSQHPSILKDPPASVLVESLGRPSVILRIYFWVNINQNNWQSVKSSAIRLVKRAFQTNGIATADENRERIFPEGLTVRIEKEHMKLKTQEPSESEEPGILSTQAEGGARSEARKIQKEARQPTDQGGDDLLSHSSPSHVDPK
jgi:small conductance mechanosensitive channel